MYSQEYDSEKTEYQYTITFTYDSAGRLVNADRPEEMKYSYKKYKSMSKQRPTEKDWEVEMTREDFMKNKFRKILTIGSAIILAAGSLAGCGARSATGNDISTVSAAATPEARDENNTVLTGEGLNEATTIVLGYQAGMGLYELDSKTHFVEDFFANEGIEVKVYG